MDFTNIKCISNKCKDKNVRMGGAGGYTGPNMVYSKVRCPECGLVLLILPMNEDMEYSFRAERTEDIERRLKKKTELKSAMRDMIELQNRIDQLKRETE